MRVGDWNIEEEEEEEKTGSQPKQFPGSAQAGGLVAKPGNGKVGFGRYCNKKTAQDGSAAGNGLLAGLALEHCTALHCGRVVSRPWCLAFAGRVSVYWGPRRPGEAKLNKLN